MKMVRGIIVVMSVVFGAVPALAQVQCPAGVVGYWPLDVDGTEAVHNTAGTLVGNVSFAAGQAGGAAFFDGNGSGSYIDAGFSAALSVAGGTTMSVAAWVYRELDGTAGDSFGTIITARTFCNTGNYQLYSNLGSNFYYSKWDSFGQEDQTFSNAPIPLQQWTHVAVTYDGNEVRYYVNGNFLNSVTPLAFGGAINAVGQNVQLGWDSCGSYFNGGLDEVAVFDVALSGAEVSDLYLEGFGGQSFCSNDADGDGVEDDVDVCPDTSGTALVDGCDCDQILDIKPGKGGQCNKGTLQVFSKRIGWASGVPSP